MVEGALRYPPQGKIWLKGHHLALLMARINVWPMPCSCVMINLTV